jgi:hypothetical protein
MEPPLGDGSAREGCRVLRKINTGSGGKEMVCRQLLDAGTASLAFNFELSTLNFFAT